MVKTDIEIAHEAKLQPVQAVAEGLGLGNGDVELYGSYKAKVRMETIERLHARRQAVRRRRVRRGLRG